MRLVIWVLAIATVVLALGWWLAGLHGTTMVTLFGTTITAPTSLWLVALAVVVVILVALVSLIAWLIRIGARLDRWSARRQRARGDASVTKTLVALAAEEQGDARREARRARASLGDTPQTLLLAAEAERMSGDDRAAAEIYATLAERQDAGLLGLRGLFRQAMTRGDWDAAAEVARSAETIHPGGNWLRGERAALAVHAGDWRQAEALAGPEAPRATYAVAAAATATDPEDGLRYAKAAYKDHADFVPAAMEYARRLRMAGRDSKAMDVLRDAWARTPVPDIAVLALEPDTDPQARLRRAARLVTTAVDHVETHLLLARLSLDADQLAAARRQLGLIRDRAADQRRYWLLLAELEASERGDTEIGRLAQRDALRRAAESGADPAWHCEQCGTTLPAWRPTCPHCATTGRVGWGSDRAVGQSVDRLGGQPPAQLSSSGLMGTGAA